MKKLSAMLSLILAVCMLAGCAGSPVIYYTDCTCPAGSHQQAPATQPQNTQPPVVAEGAVKTGLAVSTKIADSVSATADAAGAAALKQGGERRQAPAKKSKHPGLYLKFRSETDERRHKAGVITSIFEGQLPLYYYYEDEKRYEKQPQAQWVDVNDTMLAELKRLLGDENVAVKY